MPWLPVAVMTMSAQPMRLFDRLDLEAVHQRLQRVDRVDLGDRDAGALRLERLGAALADVAVATDQRGLAADQDVGAAVDAVDQRVPGAVLVVELALGDRVVDVDGRERQLTGGGELVQPQHTGGGLLGDALTDSAILVHLVLSVSKRARTSARKTFHSSESSSSAGGTTPAFSYWAPRSTSMVASPPSSRIMFAGSPGQVSICSAAHQYSSSVSPFQAKTGMPLGSSTVPCGPTTIAAAAWSWVEKMLHDAQRTSAPSADQRLDQHRGLHRHVQRAGDPRTLERQHIGVLAAQRHQSRHLVLGQPDLLAAELGQAQIGDLVVDAIADIDGQFRHVEPHFVRHCLLTRRRALATPSACGLAGQALRRSDS